MLQLSNVQLWVHDQAEALAFYTETLGWEIRDDITIEEWGFRWVSVCLPGQPEVGVVLMAMPGPPILSDDDKSALTDIVTKGLGGTLFLTTDDVQSAYDDLRARGVEFTQPPTEQPYGIDASFQDPSGNNIRIAQLN